MGLIEQRQVALDHRRPLPGIGNTRIPAHNWSRHTHNRDAKDAHRRDVVAARGRRRLRWHVAGIHRQGRAAEQQQAQQRDEQQPLEPADLPMPQALQVSHGRCSQEIARRQACAWWRGAAPMTPPDFAVPISGMGRSDAPQAPHSRASSLSSNSASSPRGSKARGRNHATWKKNRGR